MPFERFSFSEAASHKIFPPGQSASHISAFAEVNTLLSEEILAADYKVLKEERSLFLKALNQK